MQLLIRFLIGGKQRQWMSSYTPQATKGTHTYPFSTYIREPTKNVITYTSHTPRKYISLDKWLQPTGNKGWNYLSILLCDIVICCVSNESVTDRCRLCYLHHSIYRHHHMQDTLPPRSMGRQNMLKRIKDKIGMFFKLFLFFAWSFSTNMYRIPYPAQRQQDSSQWAKMLQTWRPSDLTFTHESHTIVWI